MTDNLDEFGQQVLNLIRSVDYNGLTTVIANIARNSIEENYMQGGRYGNQYLGGGATHWTPSKRANKQKYQDESGAKQSGKTLQDTGQMAASTRVNVVWTGGKFNIEMGSNKKVKDGTPLAAIHHFGAHINHPGGTPYIPFSGSGVRRFTLGEGMVLFIKKSKAETLKAKGKTVRYTKPHGIDIPARPIFVLQDEDLIQIGDKWLEYIKKTLGS